MPFFPIKAFRQKVQHPENSRQIVRKNTCARQRYADEEQEGRHTEEKTVTSEEIRGAQSSEKEEYKK